MPGLVDTTIRVLGQEPLAGRLPSGELLRLAEILDGAGFAYLEVSGGGVFDTAVRRGVESPWERIRALNERTDTPLAMALRGRFLVGSRPVGGEPSGVQLPASVELEVTETEPGVKGDTVSNETKPATVETGAVVQVPMFVNPGERIKVDPREGRYISRA